MRKDVLNRKAAFLLALISACFWLLFGFDSTPLQFIHVLYEGIPNFLLGTFNFSDLGEIYNDYYGKEMHYSAFVIYGLMYWALSRHYNKNLGITKSKNIAYTWSVVFISVATFEFFWMYAFAIYQNQAWVITPQLPQLRIHLQNILFASVGILGVTYMWLDSYVLDHKGRIIKRLYRFRWNKITLILILSTLAVFALWIYYPFHVERFEVTLENGMTWSSSNRFPQTLYTIDLDPNDSVNAGEWYYKENNWIHALNTLAKVILTSTFFYVGMVQPLGGDKPEEKINIK